MKQIVKNFQCYTSYPWKDNCNGAKGPLKRAQSKRKIKEYGKDHRKHTRFDIPAKAEITPSRLLKKTHMLRCAQSPRSDVPPKYASARRFFARLASEIFLTSLQSAFFNNLLVTFFLKTRNLPVVRGK